MRIFKKLLLVSACSLAMPTLANAQEELLKFTPIKNKADGPDSAEKNNGVNTATKSSPLVDVQPQPNHISSPLVRQMTKSSSTNQEKPASDHEGKLFFEKYSSPEVAPAKLPIVADATGKVPEPSPLKPIANSGDEHREQLQPKLEATRPPIDPALMTIPKDYQLKTLDSLPSSPVPVTLGASVNDADNQAYFKNLIYEALNYSPEIKGKQADNLAADYDIKQVKGQRWPQVTIGGQSPMANFGSGNRTNKGWSDASSSVNVTTNIYDFGLTSAKIKAAENTEISTAHDVQTTKNSVAGKLLALVIQLSQYQEELSVAERFLARMTQLTNMISEIVERDRGRGSDLVQAKAKQIEAKTYVQNIQKQLEDIQIALIRLVGHRVKLSTNVTFDKIYLTPDQVQRALDNHPLLKADQAKYEAARNEAEAAESAKYPRLNWVVTKSTAKDFDGRQDAWQTGVNLQWDIFSGGSTRASASAAVARANSSKMTLETDRLELENQIRNYSYQRDSSMQRAAEYSRLSAENNQVRDMFYQQWYYLGKRPLLDVLTAETSYFTNQISEIQTRYDGYIAGANLVTQASKVLSWAGLPND